MRPKGIFWGLIVLLLGVFLLFSNLGILPGNVWDYFWPSILILVGLWFLVGPMVFKRELTTESVSVPLNGAQQAELRLDHGAGRMDLYAMPGSLNLISGTAEGGVDLKQRSQGDSLFVHMSAQPDMFMTWPGPGHSNGLRWNFGVNPDLPIRLELHTGACESNLDLSGLKIPFLKLETGASSTEIQMPAKAGYTRAEFKSGAASLKIRVPEGVSARIRINSGLAGINVNTMRFPQNAGGYETPGFDSAENRAEIFVETGVGSVEIQ
jgi:hypothetical protein